MDEFFLIAEIKAVYGTDGFLLIDSFSDSSKRFFNLQKVFVEIFGSYRELIIENVSTIDNSIVLKFDGFNKSDELLSFVGKKIFVNKKNLIKLSDDTFFIHDLIGSKVFHGSEYLGCLEDVYLLPANDVYVVRDQKNKKILVPAVKDFIKSFDPIQKRLDLVAECDLLYDDEN